MHILHDEEIHLLRAVIGRTCDQIVCEINAVYFVFAGGATKVEAVADTPRTDHPTEEVMHLSVQRSIPAPVFTPGGEAGHWYAVVARNLVVEKLDVVRTAVVIPGERLVAPDAAPSSAFLADCGVLVHTSAGILPAVQLDDIFGFHNWSDERPRWHSPDEVSSQLHAAYQVIPVAARERPAVWAGLTMGEKRDG